MKVLVEIRRNLWGKVKDYATVKEVSLCSAVEQLLLQGLIGSGYFSGGKNKVE